MEKLKQYKYIILIAIVVLGSAFYWYEYKPSQIRKDCVKFIAKQPDIKDKGVDYFEKNYRLCLKSKGLEK